MGFLDTSTFRRFDADKMQKVGLFETSQMFCDVYCLRHAHARARWPSLVRARWTARGGKPGRWSARGTRLDGTQSELPL